MNPAAFAKAVINSASDVVEARITRAHAEIQSPQQREKDQAITLARIAVRDGRELQPSEVAIVACQLLRALGLS